MKSYTVNEGWRKLKLSQKDKIDMGTKSFASFVNVVYTLEGKMESKTFAEAAKIVSTCYWPK